MPFLKIITKNKLGKCKHISSMRRVSTAGILHNKSQSQSWYSRSEPTAQLHPHRKNITMGSQSPPESVYVVTNSAWPLHVYKP